MAYNCDTENNRKGFSFIWILENFKYLGQRTGESLDSPTFIVDTIERTKWLLSIYPRGEQSDTWISLNLWREADSKGPDTIEIDCELAFLASDGSVLTSESEHQITFMKDDNWSVEEFEEREIVVADQSKFFAQGALTIRCRIWKSIGEVRRDGHCVARTRIGVERKAFLWRIKKFSTFKIGQKITFRLKSTSDDEPIMNLNLFLRKIRKHRKICIKFLNFKQSIEFSTFKLYLVDNFGDCDHCGEFEFWFSPTAQSEEITLSLSKDKLMKNSSLYLPNDVLTLYCEQVLSTGILFEGIEGTSYGCSGSFITSNVIPENAKATDIECESVLPTDILVEGIEGTSYGCSGSSITSNVIPENAKTANIEISTSETPSLKLDLSSMLQENILCDVKLCAESEIFPAHWFILSARSPVFRVMFKSDMKEKANDRIDIEDLKPDTVRRMLLYMYTDSLEELMWETASELYVAADKYQITSLKDKCSAFLKTNLSLTNICEVLLLADLHHDKELKLAAQDFILENDKSIINSSEWKLLMKANVNLAAETMLLRFKE